MSRLNVFKSNYFRSSFVTSFITLFCGFLFLSIFFIVRSNQEKTEKEIDFLKESLQLISNTIEKNTINLQSIDLPMSIDSNIKFSLIDSFGKTIKSQSKRDLNLTWDSPDLIDAQTKGFGVDRNRLGFILVSRPLYANGELVGALIIEANKEILKDEIFRPDAYAGRMIFYCLIFALIFSYSLSRLGYEPIRQLLDVCRQISKGDYNRRVTLIPKNELGELGHALNDLSSGILKKITNLSIEKTQLKSILAVMSEGIIAVDHNGDIIFCNKNAYKLLGSKLEDVRGMNISVVPNFNMLSQLTDEVLLSQKLKNKIIKYYVSPKGVSTEEVQGSTEKILEVYATFYNSRDYKDLDFPELHMRTRRGAILILNDVTEVKKLEVIRKDFFANVSHELKTPLTSIKGYVETLAGGALEDPQFALKFINKIGTNAERLNDLVYDLLSLAKIEGSDITVEQKPLLWTPLVKETIGRYEDLISKKGLAVSIDKETAGSTLIGDAGFMATVFENLLTNAIRYSKGGGFIKVHFEKDNGFQVMHVEDDGIGIKEENLVRIFERFYRADKARSRDEGGTGLGLSIVKHLVQKMGGKVLVKSTDGAGSTFSVYLPKAF